jgi:mono/diheme cytochrome c family protein
MRYSLREIGHGLGKVAALFFIMLTPLTCLATDVEEGKILFVTYCESCHGANGDGNGPAAAEFVLKPRDFALAAFKFDTDADWQRGTDHDLADVIKEGAADFGGSNLMPGWSQLSDNEIKQLIVYIRSLQK